MITSGCRSCSNFCCVRSSSVFAKTSRDHSLPCSKRCSFSIFLHLLKTDDSSSPASCSRMLLILPRSSCSLLRVSSISFILPSSSPYSASSLLRSESLRDSRNEFIFSPGPLSRASARVCSSRCCSKSIRSRAAPGPTAKVLTVSGTALLQ